MEPYLQMNITKRSRKHILSGSVRIRLKKRKNGIFKYHTIEDTILGKSYTDPQSYDLIEVVIVNLGDADKESELEILDLLNILFPTSATPEEKKEAVT